VKDQHANVHNITAIIYYLHLLWHSYKYSSPLQVGFSKPLLLFVKGFFLQSRKATTSTTVMAMTAPNTPITAPVADDDSELLPPGTITKWGMGNVSKDREEHIYLVSN